MIRNWYNQILYPALKNQKGITFTEGMRGKQNEKPFPRQVVIQLPKLI